jgi:hypothetical protein
VATVPLKPLRSKNHLVVKNLISSYSTVKNILKIAKVKLSSCGLQKIVIAELQVSVAEQHFFKMLRNCDCGSASFKLQNCDCGLKKKLGAPTSAKRGVA